MIKNPTISVIIPTYNRANFIDVAIKSVLNQSYQDFEIIIVDDGSTDNTEEIVKNFNDFRINYFFHKFNQGISAARNTGIKACQGKYIAFLDSDDEWLPEKLDKKEGQRYLLKAIFLYPFCIRYYICMFGALFGPTYL